MPVLIHVFLLLQPVKGLADFLQDILIADGGNFRHHFVHIRIADDFAVKDIRCRGHESGFGKAPADALDMAVMP